MTDKFDKMTDSYNAHREYCADCYVLLNERSKAIIHSFLDESLPNRRELADEYEIPQYASEPRDVLKSAADLIDYMIVNQDELHSIYWANNDVSYIVGAMCFFIEKGYLVLGLYCKTRFPDTSIEDKCLSEIKKFCKSTQGYIAYEEPAPDNVPEFMNRISKINPAL